MSSARRPVELIELQPYPHLLTTEQAAEWLAVSVRTVKNLMIRGQLSYVKVGTATRFDPADLRDFVDRYRRKDRRPVRGIS